MDRLLALLLQGSEGLFISSQFLKHFPIDILGYSCLCRKGGLLLNNILMLLGGLLMLGSKYAGSFEMLIAGRFFIGVNAGINAGISPMYLTEISPVALRGAVSLS